jgi:hypothetical protein
MVGHLQLRRSELGRCGMVGGREDGRLGSGVAWEWEWEWNATNRAALLLLLLCSQSQQQLPLPLPLPPSLLGTLPLWWWWWWRPGEGEGGLRLRRAGRFGLASRVAFRFRCQLPHSSRSLVPDPMVSSMPTRLGVFEMVVVDS